MAARRWYDFESREPYLSEGINDAWWVKHLSLGKENSNDSPYLLANEWICGNIGQFLRLPIPPFGLVRPGPSRKGMFVSWKYGSRSTLPDDAKPDKCFENDPETCTGILLFDVLVANSDRHDSNLKVDDPNNPQEIYVFDHDHALFGAIGEDGISRLNSLEKRVAVSGGSVTGENRHCLIDVVTTSEHFGMWVDRIYSIPENFIRLVCNEAVGLPITKQEAEVACHFLRERKEHLADIILENKDEFSSIRDWGLPL